MHFVWEQNIFTYERRQTGLTGGLQPSLAATGQRSKNLPFRVNPRVPPSQAGFGESGDSKSQQANLSTSGGAALSPSFQPNRNTQHDTHCILPIISIPTANDAPHPTCFLQGIRDTAHSRMAKKCDFPPPRSSSSAWRHCQDALAVRQVSASRGLVRSR